MGEFGIIMRRPSDIPELELETDAEKKYEAQNLNTFHLYQN